MDIEKYTMTLKIFKYKITKPAVTRLLLVLLPVFQQLAEIFKQRRKTPLTLINTEEAITNSPGIFSAPKLNLAIFKYEITKPTVTRPSRAYLLIF